MYPTFVPPRRYATPANAQKACDDTQQHSSSSSALSAMQLANVARHSRRCARGTIERTSRRRPLSSTSIAASGDQASWVVAPLRGSSTSVVQPQSLDPKLEPPNESCSSSSGSGSSSSSNDNRSSGSNSNNRSTPPVDFSASSVDTGELFSVLDETGTCFLLKL